MSELRRTGRLEVGELERLLDVEAGPNAVLAPGLERGAEHVVLELVPVYSEPNRNAVMCSILKLNRERLQIGGAGREKGRWG